MFPMLGKDNKHGVLIAWGDADALFMPVIAAAPCRLQLPAIRRNVLSVPNNATEHHGKKRT